jgi:hypothetical protein
MQKCLSRRFLLFVSIVGLGLAIWFLVTTPGINSRNALRLRPGMTELAAEQILGGPGVLESDNPNDEFYCKLWKANQITIVIQFSAHDKTMIAGALRRVFSNGEEQVPVGGTGMYGTNLSFSEKFLIWLGLPVRG